MRGLAVGLRAGTSRVDIALGPVIGGILMQRFAWDSVFWVCAVIGIMGSLQAGAYTTGLTDALRGSHLPQGILGVSKESVMAAESISSSLPGTPHRLLDGSVASAFMDGLHIACLAAMTIALIAAVVAIVAMPKRR